MKTEDTKAWIDELRRTERLPESYSAAVFEFVAPLADRIQALHTALGRPIVVGINGAQGSGKTTFSLFLANWLERELGLASVTLSLDDLYLDKQSREALAKHHHPLLRTRGVPGTHDVALGIKTLAALTKQGPCRVVELPVFDKAKDDRSDRSEWRSIDGPVDVVLFEGWCIGAQPQSGEFLNSPANSLEAREDADGVWRGYVNESLKHDYARLFEWLDALVMLCVPSFDKVIEWRELQEEKLCEKTGPGEEAGMNPAEIGRFVMHFERLTRHMLKQMPGQANAVVDIDESHRMVAMSHNEWPIGRRTS